MPDKKGDTKSEKLLMRKYVFEGKLLKVRVDTVLGADGRRTTREIIERSDCVAVVAVDTEENILLVSQYRTPLAKNLLEIPAGGIEKGENAEKAVIREMREETGFSPAKIVRLCGGFLSPGYSSEYCSIYLVTGLNHEPLTAEDTAGIELVRMPVGQVMEAITSGKIQDGKSIAGLLYYLEYRKNNPVELAPAGEVTKPETIETLKKEWDELHALPFPESPKDEALSDLFADLVLEDGEIAGIVTSFLKGKKPDKKTIYINEELNARLRAYQPPDEADKVSQQEFIERKDRLDRLVKLVLDLYEK